jgi:hypothetical protein
MCELVTELRIVESDKNIFDTDREYIVPLYQRAYAWEDKQLTQLIEDISDVSDDSNYCIGTLIVSQKGNKYEVVDGQQRLISLYLLLNCLGMSVKNTLTFACREKSNYTLKNIKELLQENRSKLDMDRIESSIQRGIKILTQELNKEDFDRDSFIEKLSKVIVYRIEVPKHTDLNRYFEIMNTRGEQLEQYDILKASLMSYLPKDEQLVFARIWDACSDMTGYVQMHFISKNNKIRESLFGGEWNHMPPKDWSKYKSGIMAESLNRNGHRITDIIGTNFQVEDDEGYLDDDVRVRFESVIDFPYFLLHVLKVLIGTKGIVHMDGKSAIIAEQLDDKKLIESFTKVINYGCISGIKISESKESKAEFSRDFVVCLLRTRFLFDKYIVKREYTNEDADGEWSLKSLYVSGQQSKKKPYYRNSIFTKSRERSSTNDYRTKSNIMIQSALRVSYTSPKVMHWITQLLLWLSEDNCKHICDDDMVYYTDVAEQIARKAVKENFFDICADGVYAMGVNTPHIVFNYLDYIIWDSNHKKYDDFTFEFRNSVEHWYPKNPSEGTFEQWKDGADQFGNLCIIQRNVNSKFSNMSPEAKKSTFKDMIARGSLKLRIMSELTEHHGDKVASLYWKETAYQEHEKEMLTMLMRACNVQAVIVFPDDENENIVETPMELKAGSSLNVAKIVLGWAKVKEHDGEIHLDLNRCGKKYIRFTTDRTSQLLPEAAEAASGWGTKTHYFYEIVNEQGKKLYMQLALSGENLPDDLRVICDRINEEFPSRAQRTNWKWRCPFVTKRVPLNELTTEENIIALLEEQFKSIRAFEADLCAKLMRSQKNTDFF